MKRLQFAVFGIVAAVAVSACGKKEEPAPQPQAQPSAAMAPAPDGAAGMPPAGMPPHGAAPGMGGAPAGMGGPGMGGAPAAPREVVVPEDVKKMWKAVVLSLTDKKANKAEDVKVEVGQTVKKGDLEITVESFLPSFTMGGGNITSKSNSTENPAARVVVKEKGNQIYAGWLFSLYPQAHPMQHEKWALQLKDFVKK